MKRYSIQVSVHTCRHFLGTLSGLSHIKCKSLTDICFDIGKKTFRLVKSFEVNQWPDIAFPERLQSFLLALQYSLEEQKLQYLLTRTVHAELYMGQGKYSVHLVPVMHMVMHHIR